MALGYKQQPFGWGIRTEVKRLKGELLPFCVFGEITTEAKYKENARENGQPEEFPATPGALALQNPYEEEVILIAKNCPASLINDAKDVAGATNNVQFKQHEPERPAAVRPSGSY